MKIARGIGMFFSVLALLTISACSSKSSALSMTAALDEADRYIAQGYPNDALKLLRKYEKRILSPMEAIGIYKRYMTLDESKSAEKVLQESLKKNSDNLELNAVYVYFLKKNGRADEAVKYAKKLRGTKYGSLYSELFLRKEALMTEELPPESFLTEDYVLLYFDAYTGTGDNAWLRNAALCDLRNGFYGKAVSLVPADKKSAADSYFWAKVYYDAGKYGEAALCLLDAQRLLARNESRFADGLREPGASLIEVTSLLSDCYVNMGEDKEAEKVRGELIRQLTLGGENAPDEVQGGTSENLLGTIYLNSALYALQKNDEAAADKALTFVVQKWPDYVPALIAYGNFAYNTSRREMDDPLTKSLRDAGVMSSEMKKFDSRPRVSVSDALARMEEAAARTHNNLLYVAKLELEDKIDTTSDERARLARMWLVLERNTISANLYPPEISQFATHTLLRLERYDEAESLFFKYLAARYAFKPDCSLEENIIQNLAGMNLWETEYAAYFAAAQKNTDLTRRLYEYAVYESGQEYAVQSAVNLAMIYSSTGNRNKALEFYGKAGSRATDNYLRSEIMYRIGAIYDIIGDEKESQKSLEYSLYLNPGNGKARLLLNNIKVRQ